MAGVPSSRVSPVALDGARRGRQAAAPRRTRASLARRAVRPCAWAAATAAGFAVYLRLAQTRAVNSDGAAQALQAWAMLHGNPLLRGWTLSDVSFYPTELPQYALVELVRGLRADVVDIAAAMTYTLVVLLAALLAKGTATGRAALVRIAVAAGIMLAPQLGSGTNVLLSSPDHIGTSVPLLAAWLVLDRGGRRWYVPVLTSALLLWGQVADSLVLVAGIIPLTLVCALRAARAALVGRRRGAGYELAMGCGALGAAVAARWILGAITQAGGFTLRPLGTQVAPLSEIARHNLPVAAQCVALLFGAYTGGPGTAVPGIGEAPLFPLLHLAGVAIAVAGVALGAARVIIVVRRLHGHGRAGYRRPADPDLISQVLLVAIAVNVGAFAVTERVFAVSSAREIAPVLPFAAVLAARQIGPALAGHVLASPGQASPGPASRTSAGLLRLLRWLLIAAGAGYAAGLAVELTVPAAPPQAAPLTAWLERHPLGGTGLGGYWQASVVTLTSGGAVAVRPVNDTGDGVTPHPAQVAAGWFDPRRASASFFVFAPGEPEYPGFTDQRAVRATWGAPARVYHVAAFTIWYWNKNLLGTVRR